ncbi:hypothetical protein D3C77_597240 [compost metagenome]
MIRFVTQVSHHRQLLGLHLCGNLLQHFGPGNLVRQGSDDNIAIFNAVDRTHAHRAATALVDLQQFRTRGDDLGFSGIVRPLDMLAELFDGGLWLIKQTYTGTGNFT